MDTSKVKDWPGGGNLPPHVAGYQQGFFNRYQDPTENRAQLDRLAAEFPTLVTAVNLPHLSPGGLIPYAGADIPVATGSR